jgi:hypothetical protein
MTLLRLRVAANDGEALRFVGVEGVFFKALAGRAGERARARISFALESSGGSVSAAKEFSGSSDPDEAAPSGNCGISARSAASSPVRITGSRSSMKDC